MKLQEIWQIKVEQLFGGDGVCIVTPQNSELWPAA